MADLAPLEAALAIIIASFRKYAAEDKDAKSLSQKELTTLLDAELPNLMKGSTEEKAKLFNALDTDKNKSVDFNEFFALVACLAMECNCLFDQV